MSKDPITVARPFVKWAGGKTKLLSELLKVVPDRFGAYYEPFLGGGALFWRLVSEGRLQSGSRVFLHDTNADLVRTYKALRDRADSVVDVLGSMRNDVDSYLEIRSLHPALLDDAYAAARFIYLNKTCFNGLYRVNSRGFFNVPFGRYRSPTICDEANLRACSLVLRQLRVHIDTGEPGFELSERARQGDLVYFDPPYPPLSKTSAFVSYTRDRFAWKDHLTLRDLALRLKQKGVHVILSNSDQPSVRELYAEGFVVRTVSASRSVGASAATRKNVGELIIT